MLFFCCYFVCAAATERLSGYLRTSSQLHAQVSSQGRESLLLMTVTSIGLISLPLEYAPGSSSVSLEKQQAVTAGDHMT